MCIVNSTISHITYAWCGCNYVGRWPAWQTREMLHSISITHFNNKTNVLPCIAVSVRLFVTLAYCVETAKLTTKLLGTLGFNRMVSGRYLKDLMNYDNIQQRKNHVCGLHAASAYSWRLTWLEIKYRVFVTYCVVFLVRNQRGVTEFLHLQFLLARDAMHSGVRPSVCHVGMLCRNG